MRPLPAAVASTLFATLCAACALDAVPAPLGISSAPIFHGAREKAEPWVVAVHYQRPGTTKIRLCSGSVIAARAVLTAKHCVFDEPSNGTWVAMPASAFTVAVGDDITSAQGVVREVGVTEIVTTPGVYATADALAGNDIAVLKLDADAGVGAMPVSKSAPVVGDEVRIVGFGLTESNALGVKYAGTANVSKVDARLLETEGASWTCTGDSGGPALHKGRGEVLGVTSLGPSGCKTSRSIYTRVDVHAALIAQALGIPVDDAGACTQGCAGSGGSGGGGGGGGDAGGSASAGGAGAAATGGDACAGTGCASSPDGATPAPPAPPAVEQAASDGGCAVARRSGACGPSLLALGLLLALRRPFARRRVARDQFSARSW
jgi:secreted trypsin-like serine protease